MHPTELLRLFDEWEQRTRGTTTGANRMPIEPAFTPLFPKERAPRPVLDDARKPGFFDRTRSIDQESVERELTQTPETFETSGPLEIVEFELLLAADFTAKANAARTWLASLRSLAEPVSFEIIGRANRVVVQIACSVADSSSVVSSLRSYFPEAKLRESKSPFGKSGSETRDSE